MGEVPRRYATDPERFQWFQRFTLTPADVTEVVERLESGAILETMDIPTYLGVRANTQCETGAALYRLVQLWGTPNVPGRDAGTLEVERYATTWQYLFDVEYDPRPEDSESVPEQFLLSVYDYQTNVSAGLSGFCEGASEHGTVTEPVGEAVASVDLPPEEFLEGVVALVVNMVDEAVPATYEELWV